MPAPPTGRTSVPVPQMPASVAPMVPAAATPYAGFWIRVLAHFIDGIIVGLPMIPLAVVFLLPSIIRTAQSGWEDQPPAWVFTTLPLIVLAVLCMPWLYEALLTSSSWQGTIGKRILHLKVTDLEGNRISFGRASGRFFAKSLSHLVCFLLYVIVAFTDRKQGLHDMVAGTLVWKS
ncbi:MAG TPA: RDD family protein [Candidatus Angelobacter sp.]|nr:RDD family protein [Candidatus Angelobacter sp.]